MTSDVMTYTDFSGVRHQVHLDSSELATLGITATCACGATWHGLYSIEAVYEVLKLHTVPVA